MEYFDDWLGRIGTLLGLGAIFYTWMTSRSKDNSNRLDTIEQRVADHGQSIKTVETELAHLPDKDVVNELKLEITRLTGTVGQLGEKVTGLDRTVRNVDTYLRKEDK